MPDILRVQDVGLSGASDETVLAWAAQHARTLLTHDASTMPAFAYVRVQQGEPMPGVFVVGPGVGIGTAIAEILILAACSEDGEWDNQVRYLPL